MNLKESFRYQKFLDGLMRCAVDYVQTPVHCLQSTKNHLRHAVNPEAEDMVEVVDHGEFVPVDVAMAFMVSLIEEREKLSRAINAAKARIDFDMDASVETNKFRQMMSAAIRRMLVNVSSVRKIKESDYKFDVNGQQVPYRYDVEVVTTELYDRDVAKALVRATISKADDVSAEIDAAMVNTVVEYDPPYDVNEQFTDVLDLYLQKMTSPETKAA